MTKTDDGTATPDRQEMVDRLPEASPLSGVLVDLVGATDRAKMAAEHNLDFREATQDVRVQIELEVDATMPDGYRLERISQTGGYVIAYVHVDDLVSLAMEPAVRKLQRPPESRTQSGTY